MNYRRAWLLVAALVLALAGAVGAEECAHHCAAECAKDSAMTRGTWALQFGIDRDFTLGSFDGSVISARRLLTARDALQFGVGFDMMDGDRSNDYSNEHRGDTTTSKHTEETESWDVAISASWVRFFRPANAVRGFVRVGPVAGFEKYEQISVRDYSRPDTSFTETHRQKRETWFAGVSATIGAEWMVHEVVSLHVESGIRAEYCSMDRDSSDDPLRRDRSEEETAFKVLPAAVRFGISVYF